MGHFVLGFKILIGFKNKLVLKVIFLFLKGIKYKCVDNDEIFKYTFGKA